MKKIITQKRGAKVQPKFGIAIAFDVKKG